jgi:histone H3/H4
MKIPKATIRKIVHSRARVKISEDAADAIARMLEKKAASIASFAVKRAKSHKRSIVAEEDVDAYRLRFGE